MLPGLGRYFFTDQVIQQKPLLRFIGILIKRPGTGGLADRIPGPHRARLDGFTESAHTAYLSMFRFNPDPVAVIEAVLCTNARAQEQVIVRMNLAQPGVLGIP